MSTKLRGSSIFGMQHAMYHPVNTRQVPGIASGAGDTPLSEQPTLLDAQYN